MSQESHQTLSLCVPVNSLRPMSFATSACTVSFVGVWALIAVFTIGTSIRWLGMLSETKTVALPRHTRASRAPSASTT